MKFDPKHRHPHNVLRRAHSCDLKPVPVHSADVDRIYRVHCRWHVYFGEDVKVLHLLNRSDGQLGRIERDKGIVIDAQSWGFDAALCLSLELCGVVEAGAVDQDRIYDPRPPNDRLQRIAIRPIIGVRDIDIGQR